MRNKEMSKHEEQQKQEDAFFFLSKDAREQLPRFQYKGVDQSLLYNYVLSPLAAFLVNNCTPSTLAPNTITLFGLSFMIASYVFLWYYAPLVDASSSTFSFHKDTDSYTDTNSNTDTDGDDDFIIPRWVFLYQSCAMLIYQTLDNMDGKQARKTKSSSPLGLLFDHGCDAVNVIFGCAGWILGLGLTLQHDPILCTSLILGPFAMFYIPTWEEYYTGEMILPLINGPTEGVAGGALLSLTTYFYGTEWWQSTSIADMLLLHVGGMKTSDTFVLRNADIQVALACFGMLRECISRTYMVCCNRKGKDGGGGGLSALVTQIPYWILVAAGVTGGPFVRRMPRTSLHLASGLLVESVTQLMLDHITAQQFQIQRRFVLWPLVMVYLPYLLVGGGGGGGEPNGTTDACMIIYATAVWTYLVVKIRFVVHEICITLNLKCFDITTAATTTTTTARSSSSSITAEDRNKMA